MASELPDLKRRLIELAASADARFAAAPEHEREIVALVERLEQLNPTHEPARCASLLDGRWRMRYSSFKLDRNPTLNRLAFGKLPAIEVRVAGIYQEVDTSGGHFNSLVVFTRNGASGIHVIAGRFRPIDGTRLDINFFATHVRALNGDTAALHRALGVADERELSAQLEAPPLWSEVSYLDQDLRLMRASYRNLHVLTRDEAQPVTLDQVAGSR